MMAFFGSENKTMADKINFQRSDELIFDSKNIQREMKRENRGVL
jgi:hypothetical protein